MNVGKKFEQNFRNCIDKNNNNIFFYRFKDGTANWAGGNNENVRFQSKNACDCMIFYNSKTLFLIELKNHKGKSLPIGCIRDNQVKEMTEYSIKNGVIPLLIVNFSDVERCFAITFNQYNKFMEENDRKSVPLEFFEDNGFEIEVIKLKTNYRYNIEKLLNYYWKGEMFDAI